MSLEEDGIDVDDLVTEVSGADLDQLGHQRREMGFGRGGQEQRPAVEGHATGAHAEELVRLVVGPVPDSRHQPSGHLLLDAPSEDQQRLEVQAASPPDDLAPGKRAFDAAIGREENVTWPDVDPKAAEQATQQLEKAGIGGPNRELHPLDVVVIGSDPT